MSRCVAKLSLSLALCACAAGVEAPLPAAGPLQVTLHAAADEYGVPRALLVALGWVDSRLSMNQGAVSLDGAYGLFHLVDGEAAAQVDGPQRAQSLLLAAKLTGLPPDALRTDAQANARGAAALLRAELDRLTARYPDLREERLGDWFEVIMRASGVEDAQLADGFASQVYRLLRDGLVARDAQGGLVRVPAQTFDLAGRGIWAVLEQDLSGEYCPNGVCVAWKPAANFTTGRSGKQITTVVIHDIEGSYESAIAYFQRSTTQASAHYCIRSVDGELTQQVQHADTAWHAGNSAVNRTSIGIEHEGFAAEGTRWFTEAMYRSSAALVRWLSDTYNFPRDRTHIIGHYEVPDAGNAGWYGGAGHHHDPCHGWLGSPTWHNVNGCDWDWAHYLDLVNGASGPVGTLTGFVGDACCGITAGSRKPLVGATVALVGTSLVTTTAANGVYTFSLAPGTYTPRATAAGYAGGDHTSLGSGYSAALSVAANGTTYGSIVLALTAPAPQKPVVTITHPADGSSASSSPLTVSGTVDDRGVTAVVIGGQSFATQNGAFTGSIALLAGLNTITVTATNAAGTGSSSVQVSYAPPSTGVQGSVKDLATQSPLAGVAVALSSALAPTGLHTVTDATGHYDLGAAPGSYSLLVDAAGYLRQTLAIVVLQDRILTQDVALVVDPMARPHVRIDQPGDGQTFVDPIINVTGQAFVPGLAEVQLNTEQVAFSADGAFAVQLELSVGRNEIQIQATDSSGRSFSSTVVVDFAPLASSAGGCSGSAASGWMALFALLPAFALRRRGKSC